MLKGVIGTSTAVLVMIFVMLPFFLLAMYERNGQPLEKVLRNMVNVIFVRPKQRPYKTKNYYACLMKQKKLYEEVQSKVEKAHSQGAEKFVRAGIHPISANVPGWNLSGG